MTILTHWREMMMIIIIIVKKMNAMYLPPHFKFVQICMYTFFIIIITNGFACVVISLDPYIIVRFIRVYTPFNMLHSSIIFNRSASGKIFSDLRRRRFSYWCNFLKDFYFVPQLHFALKTSGLISCRFWVGRTVIEYQLNCIQIIIDSRRALEAWLEAFFCNFSFQMKSCI